MASPIVEAALPAGQEGPDICSRIIVYNRKGDRYSRIHPDIRLRYNNAKEEGPDR
jgi:hypothetical protein